MTPDYVKHAKELLGKIDHKANVALTISPGSRSMRIFWGSVYNQLVVTGMLKKIEDLDKWEKDLLWSEIKLICNPKLYDKEHLIMIVRSLYTLEYLLNDNLPNN